jgi:MFS family permease
MEWVGLQIFVVLSTTVLTNGKHLSFTNSLFMLVFSNALAYVGYVVHGWVGDKVGRRETIMVSWILAGLSYGIMLLFAHSFMAVMITYSIGLFFIIGSNAALFSYVSESYPTRMRGTAASVINAMGPIGAIIGSALFSAFIGNAGVIKGALFAGVLPLLISGFLMLGTRRVKPGQDLEAISN